MSVFGLKLSIPKRSLNDGKVREAVIPCNGSKVGSEPKLLKNSESAQIRIKECPHRPARLFQLRGRPKSDAGHQRASL